MGMAGLIFELRPSYFVKMHNFQRCTNDVSMTFISLLVPDFKNIFATRLFSSLSQKQQVLDAKTLKTLYAILALFLFVAKTASKTSTKNCDLTFLLFVARSTKSSSKVVTISGREMKGDVSQVRKGDKICIFSQESWQSPKQCGLLNRLEYFQTYLQVILLQSRYLFLHTQQLHSHFWSKLHKTKWGMCNIRYYILSKKNCKNM